MASNHRLVVGIDFGTTNTSRPDYPSPWSQEKKLLISVPGKAPTSAMWPGVTGLIAKSKTPSKIAYVEDNPRLRQRLWGHQVQPEMVSTSWVKLFLEEDPSFTGPNQAALEWTTSTGIMRLTNGKVATVVVADFLHEVYKYLYHVLEGVFSRQQKRLSDYPIDFWFTVPESWSDGARKATRDAAAQAGFGSRPGDFISIITEPEAAIGATLIKSRLPGQDFFLAPGDSVVICDCGGGTVDIASYYISDVQPLRYDELAHSTSVLCGATAIDRNFYALMYARFGQAFGDIPIQFRCPGSEFMTAFEKVKCSFDGSLNEDGHDIAVPMVAPQTCNPLWYNHSDRMIKLSRYDQPSGSVKYGMAEEIAYHLLSDRADMHALVEPVVRQICELVHKQIAAARKQMHNFTVNKIIFGRGFSLSPYLYDKVRETFHREGHVTVHRPVGAQWSTAPLYGGPKDSSLRPGWLAATTGSRHPVSVNIYTGATIVDGMIDWVIIKGQWYGDHHITTYQTKCVHKEENILWKLLSIYASSMEPAPKRVDQPGVSLVGEVVCDFSKIRLAQFGHKEIGGRLVYELEYTVRITMGRYNGSILVEALVQDSVIGETRID